MYETIEQEISIDQMVTFDLRLTMLPFIRHKTKEIRNLIDCNELHMLTILPYWPSLNGVETVIQSIKAKLKVKQAKGK